MYRIEVADTVLITRRDSMSCRLVRLDRLQTTQAAPSSHHRLRCTKEIQTKLY
ncbi:hypothetical protein OESDEN_05896 [Oesophagostomum dentatum]|uniref:Uncharacterized protein n=1 Tax=Oesophagostomum dentatum TaxID=61180 RepID=A0A0B1T9H0_OESDE|nr:hypothetical protein OESDEN_05896 [Oesophagostomum dentatum]